MFWVVTGAGLSRLQSAARKTFQALAVLSDAKSNVVHMRLAVSQP